MRKHNLFLFAQRDYRITRACKSYFAHLGVHLRMPPPPTTTMYHCTHTWLFMHYWDVVFFLCIETEYRRSLGLIMWVHSIIALNFFLTFRTITLHQWKYSVRWRNWLFFGCHGFHFFFLHFHILLRLKDTSLVCNSTAAIARRNKKIRSRQYPWSSNL